VAQGSPNSQCYWRIFSRVLTGAIRIGERAVPDQPQAMHRQMRAVQCIICDRLV
jgi:hypothetical protein